ncbi:MAG: hypothetical protein JXR63_11825 [Spirochaetales bacterium]|nr:hypothetical protein [Spirochaetales bacterium]
MADANDSVLLGDSEQQNQEEKVYCANCKNCKLIRVEGTAERFRLRVRCAAGKWKKKNGGEKYYKYFTVVRRKEPTCDSYIPMGSEKEFLRELKRELPTEDVEYDAATQY